MRKLTIAFITAALLAGSALAQPPPVVEPLTALDRTYMREQRQRIDALARLHLGRQLRKNKDHDLAILQDLLTQRRVQPEQTLELQAMGVVLGELLAAELGMDWVVYSDQYGRSRALRLGSTDNYLFPMTMIARRVEAGAQVSVAAVYDKAYQIIALHVTPLPFQ